MTNNLDHPNPMLFDSQENKSVRRNDRMKSEIFFGYEPSLSLSNSNSRRSSADADANAERKEDLNDELNLGRKDEDLGDYPPSNSRSISSVFETDSSSSSVFKGARRHYSRHQTTSDIFFRSSGHDEQPSVSRKQPLPPTAAYQAPQWVPSVKMSSKSTSFSNIFGASPDIDAQVRSEHPVRSPRKTFEAREKMVHTFGLSSSDMNRQHRGKGARRAVGGPSQISWF